MSLRAIATRIRNAIFGTPLTHEQAEHVRDAQNALERTRGRHDVERPGPPVFPTGL